MHVPYLTIHRLSGDADDLLERKRRHFDPVIGDIAPRYGAILSITAKTEDGLLIVNLWTSAEGPGEFAQVPEVQQAQRASELPAPRSFERYEQVWLDAYAVEGDAGG
jgi:hypothetical protein